MYLGDLIDTAEVCDLLKVSKPTFKKYRSTYSIQEFKIRKKIQFSKTEILQKLFVTLIPLGEKFSFSMHSHNSFEVLKIDDSTYDLRRVNSIDGHGAISLVCHLMSEIKKENKFIHIVIDEKSDFLRGMVFFEVLKQYLNSKIFWDESYFSLILDCEYKTLIKLPITKLGVVGSHSKITDDFTIHLFSQGYSQDICSYKGWAIGELTDNSATHAQVYPCFVYCEQFAEDRRYLQ